MPHGVANLARQKPSPNRDARPAPCEVSLVVVHGISLPPGQFGGDAIERLFTNGLDTGAHPYFTSITELRVSAHFLVRRDGALIQFVPCSERAWHAGQSAWRGRQRCNDFSIGIELEGATTSLMRARSTQCWPGSSGRSRAATRSRTWLGTATSPPGARRIPDPGSTGCGSSVLRGEAHSAGRRQALPGRVATI
jgi:hypothetical protein